MLKFVLAGTTALAIAGGSLAYAQQPAAQPDAQHWRPSAEDMSAMLDARIVALKTALKLTAEQEKNWPAFEAAIRDIAKTRQARMQARRDRPHDQARTDLIERLRQRATAMTEGAANLKRLADAAKPLYDSLDEGQKHRFALVAHFGHHRFAMMEHHDHGDRQGPGGR